MSTSKGTCIKLNSSLYSQSGLFSNTLLGISSSNDSNAQARRWDHLQSLSFTNSSNPNHHRSYQFYFLNISGIYCLLSILTFIALVNEFIFHLNHCNSLQTIGPTYSCQEPWKSSDLPYSGWMLAMSWMLTEYMRLLGQIRRTLQLSVEQVAGKLPFCSGLFFQGRLYSKHLWKMEIETQRAAALLAAHYKIIKYSGSLSSLRVSHGDRTSTSCIASAWVTPCCPCDSQEARRNWDELVPDSQDMQKSDKLMGNCLPTTVKI